MMDNITKHPDGMTQIRVPMGNPPWINSYLLADGDGYALIDPGPHSAGTVEFWRKVSGEIGFAFDQVRKIIITHHHPDHYGLAGWFQQQSGAPVYVSPAARRQIEGLWSGSRPLVDEMMAMYRQNGIPDEVYADMAEHWRVNADQVNPQPELTDIHPGDRLDIGGVSYDILSIPGHAAGHIGLYSRERKVLFCGDQVMPDSLPDTCYVPGGVDESPIRSFLESLDRLEAYEVELAFPGHYNAFSSFRKRLAELRALNEERQDNLLSKLGPEPMSAYEVYVQAFDRANSILQLRFGFTETISRLRYAKSLALVQEEVSEGKLLYRKTRQLEEGH